MALPTRVNRTLAVDPFDGLQRDFESMLGRMINGRSNGGATQFAPYGVDVREDADHLYVEAELPGFKKDEVDITLENQTLTISGERRESSEKKGDWLLNERRYTRFQRSFTLPPTISEQSVDARLENGLLTITLNKREESKPRKIAVA
jgi:HSP20 family protein